MCWTFALCKGCWLQQGWLDLHIRIISLAYLSILAINSSCNQWLWHDLYHSYKVENQSVYRRNELHMTYAALDICVCTRGIVYELFHTHLTKHHIICDRLPQLIIHFARKVSHHEWWWIHFTVSSYLDFSIIPYRRNTDHVNLMFLFALLLLVAVSCIMSSSETKSFSVIRNT